MTVTPSNPAQNQAEHTCPNCGHEIGLTTQPNDVPKTGGRLKVHSRNELGLLARARTAQDRVTDQITTFAGSLQFVYIHSVWFLLWVVVNAGLIGVGAEFDAYPFGLLTLIVSLEAIFLSTFVMISQNRQAARADVRAELDFETNLRSEIWTLHIGRKLGLDPREIEGHVHDVLARSNAALSDGSKGDPLDADPEIMTPAQT